MVAVRNHLRQRVDGGLWSDFPLPAAKRGERVRERGLFFAVHLLSSIE
jgi:hypothetical protein